MPVLKSFFWKAASASRRKAAAALLTPPASPLICASSLIAASSSATCLNGLSAAIAAVMPRPRAAAARPARTKQIMGIVLPRQRIAANRIASPDGVEHVAAARRRCEDAAHFLKLIRDQLAQLISSDDVAPIGKRP